MWESMQPLCRCQKQPWTWMIFLSRGKTKSGFPGKAATCRRYRKPMPCTSRRTAISGDVFLARILLTLAERRSGVRLSNCSYFLGLRGNKATVWVGYLPTSHFSTRS